MAKNKNKKPQDELSSDEILDNMAEDTSAQGEDEPVVPEGRQTRSKKDLEYPWAPQPGHKGVTDMLMGKDAQADVDLSEDYKVGGGKGFANFFLLILVLAAAGAGTWQLYNVGSAEAIEMRRARREERERTNLEEQLAKQKKYGVMRIESMPTQALIYKNDQLVVVHKEGAIPCNSNADCTEGLICAVDESNEAQEKKCGVAAKTPMNMMGLNIDEIHAFRLSYPSYEDWDFHVAEHLWTKDAASGEYRFLKVVEMNPEPCLYWFLYDQAKKEEQKFEDPELCKAYFKQATDEKVGVTECACKPLPAEGENPEEKKAP